MHYFVSAMGYGDCLMTLALLERIGAGREPYRVIGTRVTRQVNSLLRRPLPVTEILPDTAAFYVIKERGVGAAVRDLVSMRRSLSKLAEPGDLLVFERGGLRNRLVKPRSARAVYIGRNSSAYEDRRTIAFSLFGDVPAWPAVRQPSGPVRRLLLNPCARFQHKSLSPAMVADLLSLAERSGWQVTLLDPCGSYAQTEGRIQLYRSRPDLAESAALLRLADLYIGPDSFFMHLAYYYGVPLFCMFHPENLYFQPPGMRELGNFVLFRDAANPGEMERRLKEFIQQ